MRSISRRNFIKAAAAFPLLGARTAKSRTPFERLAGRARHILILNAAGGLRTAPFFFGDAATQHNPYGAATNRGPSEWLPGSLLGGAAALSGELAVLAGVDHLPNGDAITDHADAAHRLTVVNTELGDSGLLSIIHRKHAAYRDNALALPPINIGYSNFAAGLGPLEIRSAEVFRGRSKTAEHAKNAAWMFDLQTRRDQSLLGGRDETTQKLIAARIATHQAARNYGNYLRDPALDLLGAPDAELGGLNNSQLLAALGGDTSWGLETAFSLRAFQLGVPAVAITRDVFDTHSNEHDTLAAEAAHLAQQISGLHHLLHRLFEPDGTPLWETTVVFVVSEFGRDNTHPDTGYNFGGGSDHLGTPASRNQLWPIFGGPLAARGRMIGRLDPLTLATIDRPAIAVDAVRATMLALLGIDPDPYFANPPLAELFT